VTIPHAYPSVLLACALAVPEGWLAWLVIRRSSKSGDARQRWIIAAIALLNIWAATVMPSEFLLATTMVLAWVLLVLGAIDMLAFRLPDFLTLPLIAAGIFVSLRLPDYDPIAHVAGAAIGFAVLSGISVAYRAARGREGLGLGDAKLAAAAGAWLGWRALPSLVLIACAAGFVAIGIGVILRGKTALNEQIAFGVPLCLAFWIVWLYGPPGL
jgi:leader peptidase (prepilin peptidase)/N-methyltransferase